MVQRKDILDKQERRKYIRLDSVFPVQFRILSLDGKEFLSDWLQGFTNNIAKGGVCLEVNNLKPELIQVINTKDIKLALDIEIPLNSCPAAAEVKISWIREAAGQPNKYIMGLNYIEIAGRQNSRIIHYARMKKWFIPFVFLTVGIIASAFFAGSYLNLKLIKGNKALVEQLIAIVQESSVAKQKIKQINKEKEDLQISLLSLKTQLETADEERLKLEDKAGLEEKKAVRGQELAVLIDKITQEKNQLQEKLSALQNKESVVTEELLHLDKKKASLEKANLEKMYQWLKVHQNPRTGLVMSFEGDESVANWAFIYDQALALLAYTNLSDFGRAKKILDFFQAEAKRQDGRFFNAYYASDGEPAEFIVHSGPNIWLGIAVTQYTKKTQDKSYLGLAEEIARGIINLQDEDGGIRGGAEVRWYSTEHNLDAYAFLNMLWMVTRNEQYLNSRNKVLDWLAVNTYSNKGGVPIKRGKGDATIATDTYAWSIAAIGPAKLEEMGMNPEMIIEFAERSCLVEVQYLRPEGKTVLVKGFDFASAAHLARGGVVSSEWTAQMVLAYRIMADFYYNKGLAAKGHSYEVKADEYLSSLSNMIISSPSPSGQGESCLPYATEEAVDTGHGWRTPKGKSTGSVAGTAYTLFAYYKFNPLELK
ncbi:MAG: hypothetical protein V2A64_06175 [Candidatus Omnitrophota bacterium]